MGRAHSRLRRKDGFGFEAGDLLADKYEILERLGGGWEGEVYLVRERPTGIERAAKLFFPKRNPRRRTSNFYARKLHKLRDARILIQYHNQETIDIDDEPVTFLVSDYVAGEILSDFLRRQPRRRLETFEALHLLRVLAAGVAVIHNRREYHGDLHTENVIIRRQGLTFDLKLVDMYQWGPCRRVNIEDDVVDLVHLFHETVGGPRAYPSQPPEVKAICRGLRRSLILERFRTAGQLRDWLDRLPWRSR